MLRFRIIKRKCGHEWQRERESRIERCINKREMEAYTVGDGERDGERS